MGHVFSNIQYVSGSTILNGLEPFCGSAHPACYIYLSTVRFLFTRKNKAWFSPCSIRFQKGFYPIIVVDDGFCCQGSAG